MQELSLEQLENVSGGNPFLIVSAVMAYGAALDTAWSFGEGFGAGLYDALH